MKKKLTLLSLTLFLSSLLLAHCEPPPFNPSGYHCLQNADCLRGYRCQKQRCQLDTSTTSEKFSPKEQTSEKPSLNEKPQTTEPPPSKETSDAGAQPEP